MADFAETIGWIVIFYALAIPIIGLLHAWFDR